MAPPLTPTRSPAPPRRRRGRQVTGAGRRTAGQRRTPRAASLATAGDASKSDKETPTVVLTTSPVPRTGSGGGRSWRRAAGGSGGTTPVRSRGDAGATTPRPAPEKLFASSPRSASSSSPGSRAEQSLAEEDGGSERQRGGDEVDSPETGGEDAEDESPGRGEEEEEEEEEEGGATGSEEAKRRRAVNVVQCVLESGVAAVCRLRQLFPPAFFVKSDFQGTTITNFDEDLLKRIVAGPQDEERDEEESQSSEEEASLVTSVAPETQKSLSPLTALTAMTALTQKKVRAGGDAAASAAARSPERAGGGDQERRRALEALLLLKWVQGEGAGGILQAGNLSRVVFSVCVPARDAPGSGAGADAAADEDTVLESYSVSAEQ